MSELLSSDTLLDFAVIIYFTYNDIVIKTNT